MEVRLSGLFAIQLALDNIFCELERGGEAEESAPSSLMIIALKRDAVE